MGSFKATLASRSSNLADILNRNLRDLENAFRSPFEVSVPAGRSLGSAASISHSSLSGRDGIDQHTMESITGLSALMDSLNPIASLSGVGYVVRSMDGSYFTDSTAYIPMAQKGVASGVAPLGADGLIPAQYLNANLAAIAALTTTAYGRGVLPLADAAAARAYIGAQAAGSYQPLDADLTSIAGIAGTTGILRKTAVDTWGLDTATYLTGNQSITISGIVNGVGTTAITTTMNDGALSIAKTSGLQDALDRKVSAGSMSDVGVGSSGNAYIYAVQLRIPKQTAGQYNYGRYRFAMIIRGSNIANYGCIELVVNCSYENTVFTHSSLATNSDGAVYDHVMMTFTTDDNYAYLKYAVYCPNYTILSVRIVSSDGNATIVGYTGLFAMTGGTILTRSAALRKILSTIGTAIEISATTNRVDFAAATSSANAVGIGVRSIYTDSGALRIDGDVVSSSSIKAESTLEAVTGIYNRAHHYCLNSTGTGWNKWGNRNSDGTMTLTARVTGNVTGNVTGQVYYTKNSPNGGATVDGSFGMYDISGISVTINNVAAEGARCVFTARTNAGTVFFTDVNTGQQKSQSIAQCGAIMLTRFGGGWNVV